MTTKDQAGTGEAAAAAAEQTLVIVGRFQPGQVYRVVFITPDQAKQLPALPDDALQIAVAPGRRPIAHVSQAIHRRHHRARPLR